MAHAQSLLDICPTSTGIREGKEAAFSPCSRVPPSDSFFPLLEVKFRPQGREGGREGAGRGEACPQDSLGHGDMKASLAGTNTSYQSGDYVH